MTTTTETMAVAVAGCLADLISQCQIATVVWHNLLKGCGAVSLGPRACNLLNVAGCQPADRVGECEYVHRWRLRVSWRNGAR